MPFPRPLILSSPMVDHRTRLIHTHGQQIRRTMGPVAVGTFILSNPLNSLPHIYPVHSSVGTISILKRPGLEVGKHGFYLRVTHTFLSPRQLL